MMRMKKIEKSIGDIESRNISFNLILIKNEKAKSLSIIGHWGLRVNSIPFYFDIKSCHSQILEQGVLFL